MTAWNQPKTYLHVCRNGNKLACLTTPLNLGPYTQQELDDCKMHTSIWVTFGLKYINSKVWQTTHIWKLLVMSMIRWESGVIFIDNHSKVENHCIPLSSLFCKQIRVVVDIMFKVIWCQLYNCSNIILWGYLDLQTNSWIHLKNWCREWRKWVWKQ